MSKIYEVSTRITITFRYNNFLGKMKAKRNEWFKYNTKYIYAKSADDACDKYKELYYHKLRWVTKEELLRAALLEYDSKSDGMHFRLYSNMDIYDIKEEFTTLTGDVLPVSINELKDKMPAEDFKNWWNDELASSTQYNNYLLYNVLYGQ